VFNAVCLSKCLFVAAIIILVFTDLIKQNATLSTNTNKLLLSELQHQKASLITKSKHSFDFNSTFITTGMNEIGMTLTFNVNSQNSFKPR